jgi:hypothetical protein
MTPPVSARGRRTKAQQKITMPLQLHCRAIAARWRVTPTGALSYSPLPSGEVELNPWEVRDKFLSLDQNTEELVTFLDGTGFWDPLPSSSVQDYWEWQDVFKAVVSHPRNWRDIVSSISPTKARRLSSVPKCHLSFTSNEKPEDVVVSCTSNSVLGAIVLSVFIDEAKRQRHRQRHSSNANTKPTKRKSSPRKTRKLLK